MAGPQLDPDIFAAGDCASFPWQGTRTRLESVQNAIEQAEHAAAANAGCRRTLQSRAVVLVGSVRREAADRRPQRGYEQVVVRPGRRPGSQSVWYYGKAS